MTKGQMKEVLEKIEALEKILMRELDEQEIEYLKDHSVNEFIYDVLEFDKEDLVVLLKVKKIISDWCTRPEEDFNDAVEDMNFFKDIDESLISESDIDLFKESHRKVDHKVSQLLSTIIAEFNDNIKPRRVVRVTSADQAEPVEESFDFTDDAEIPDEFGTEINEEEAGSVMDAVPENAKKWAKDLGIEEIEEAIDNATEVVVQDFLNKISEENIKIDHYDWMKINNYSRKFASNPEFEDMLIGEIVDQIKDIAIQHYVELIQKEGEWAFDDEEIQSEVLDYLYRHNYKVKTINNKISLV